MRFIITVEHTKDLPNFIPRLIVSVEDRIKSYLNNKNYGNEVEEFLIPLRILNPLLGFDGFFKPISVYKKKDRQIVISSKLSFEEIIKAEENEIFSMVSKNILDVVSSSKEIRNVKFDADLLYADIQKALSNW